MADFSFSASNKVDVVVVSIGGSIDAHVAVQFEQKMNEVLSKSSKIVLDLSKLDYIATAGLGVLAAAKNQASAKGGDVIIAAPIDKVKKVFDTMGFSKVFKITATVDEAVSSF